MSEESNTHSRPPHRGPRTQHSGGQRHSSGQFRRHDGRPHGDRRPHHESHEGQSDQRQHRDHYREHNDHEEQPRHQASATRNEPRGNTDDLRATAEEAIRLASSLRDKLVELKQNTLKTAIAVTKEQIAKTKSATEEQKGKKGILTLTLGRTALNMLEGVAKKKGYESVQEFAVHEILKTVRNGIEKRLKK